MGFDRHWLMLREPADMRSRDPGILSAATRAIETGSGDTLLDIGCGTGSTYRSIAPHLLRKVHWRLLDNDQALLDEATARHGDAVETIQMDLNRIDALPLDDVGFVSASALFDLCSANFIECFARKLSHTGAGLYAALNYDGIMTWTDEHPLDLAVAGAFNAHQLSDKGFGLSLGPGAWQNLADVLTAEGYEVRTADSSWVLKGADVDLQLSLLGGIVNAVEQYGQLENRDLIDWHAHRCRSALEERGLCRIGHRDLVALR